MQELCRRHNLQKQSAVECGGYGGERRRAAKSGEELLGAAESGKERQKAAECGRGRQSAAECGRVRRRAVWQEKRFGNEG